jgi:hypothetical protein
MEVIRSSQRAGRTLIFRTWMTQLKESFMKGPELA